MAGLETLQKLAFGLVFLGITVGIGAYVLVSVNSKVSDTTATQIMGNASSALLDLTSWLPILVIAAVGGIAIMFVIGYMSGRG